jgi:hypothetical protein
MITALYLPVSESIRFSALSKRGAEAVYTVPIATVREELTYVFDQPNPINLCRKMQEFFVLEECAVGLKEIRDSAEEAIKGK